MPLAAQPNNPAPTPAPRPRWWPALVLLGLNLLALVWIRQFEITHTQGRNLQTLAVCLVTGFLLLLWCLFFSRLRWPIRIGVLAGVILTLAGLGATVRITGVTGDLVPIIEWRWARGPTTATAPQAAATPPVAPTNAPGRAAASLEDWPQFLGPHRNATVTGRKLKREWQITPPQELWRHPVGPAWSGFAIAGDIAVTLEQRGPDEWVTAYDANSGRSRWTHADPARYATTIAGEGPRTTPTIDGERVFALGATGILNCLDLRTGRRIWTTNILTANGSATPVWGLSGSPLVLGERVIVSAGGPDHRSLVAYDKATGRFLWGAGSDSIGYSSPTLCELDGLAQIVIFNHRSVAGHRADTGEWLWSHPWSATHPHVADPVPIGPDQIVVSSGYGNGSEALQIQRATNGTWSAKRLWKTLRLKAKFANFTARDGFLYGLDDGILACLDAGTGEQRWKEGRYGHGQLILVDALLLVTAENGEVVLLEVNPTGPRELGRFKAFTAKTWNSPALAGDRLYLRNDREAACFRLPLEP
jgi:outer membrane protein assembly factor BamB